MALENLLGPLAAFSGSVIWAIASVQYAKLAHKHSAFSINFMRAVSSLPLFIVASFLVAGSLEAGWVLFQQVEVFHMGWAGISMIATYGLGDVLFLVSSRMIGLQTALAIASCSPIWTVLAESVIDGKTISLSSWSGLFCAVSGVICVVLAGGSQKNADEDQPKAHGSRKKGIALALTTSFCWAINNYAFAKLSLGLANPVANACRMFMALIIIFIVGGFYKAPKKLILPKDVLKKFLPFFAAEAFLGSFCIAYGFAHSSLAIGATLTSLAPVVSVPISVTLGLEKFSWVKTAGVLCVVLGVCLLVGAISF